MISNFSDIDDFSTMDDPSIQTELSFSDYIALCRKLIIARRQDLNQSDQMTSTIIQANSPFSLMPPTLSNHPFDYAALLVHGLYDCPFTMQDIGKALQNQGIPSHAILLPGHGTRPSDLLHVAYPAWINAVKYGVASLRKKAKRLFIVGYSTGAALAIHHALHDTDIAGLVILAPAIDVHPSVYSGLLWHRIKSLVQKNKEWAHRAEEIDYVKYCSFTLNSILQVTALAKLNKQLVSANPLSLPVLMILSHDDETISAKKAIRFFQALPHPRNRLLLYTTKKTHFRDSRIEPQHIAGKDPHIHSYSHMCLPFSPTNTHYGINGDFLSVTKERDYLLGAYNGATEKYYSIMKTIGLLQKPRKKLTYNPDFDHLAREIVRFIVM